MQPQAEYDVVVAGSGVGGLGASLAAAEAGLSVLVLEKDRLLGGGTALSAGGLWAGCNHLQRGAGLADSREAVLNYLHFVRGRSSQPAHLAAFLHHAPVALPAFEEFRRKTPLLAGLPHH